MKLLQCVNDSPYILWQLYIQMLNFRDFGYEKDAVILVSCETEPSPGMLTFQKWTEASVHFLKDTRTQKGYFSSFRPNLIAQYLFKHPLTEFFYHDQDVIFRRKVDLEALADDGSHYVSEEATSYLEVSYVTSFKKYDHLQDMCEIVGIDRRVVEAFDRLAAVGGAQYIIKGTGPTFWLKVERDCEAIYKKLKEDTAADREGKVHHIQVWTADMWALLYNLYMTGRPVKTDKEIGFCWPWEDDTTSKPIFHNAGIDPSNTMLPDGTKNYFYKNQYTDKYPFDETHDYVRLGAAQHEYLAYFKRAGAAAGRHNPIRRILGVFCTHNKINAALLDTVLARIKKAADGAVNCSVEVITCSWEPIENNPFTGLLTPFHVHSHLNYILQIRQVLATYPHNDIVCMLEHDMLYPENYFDVIAQNWNPEKYGVYNLNYIGMNDTGYLQVRQRDCPMSVCSAARFYFDKFINRKLDEALDKYSSANRSVFVEPPIEDFHIIPYTGVAPSVHVNMNQRGNWGTGSLGKNHHFTNHCEVCYEQQSNGFETDAYWGNYKNLIPA